MKFPIYRHLALAALFCACLSCNATSVFSAGKPMTALAFVDQYNLRRMWKFTEPEIRAQADEARRNMRLAKHYQMTDYILFSRCFDGLVSYDFTDPILGNLSGVVFPENDHHRQVQAIWSKYVKEVIDYGSALGLKVIFHTNQFDYPATLMALAGDRLSGTAPVCPAKPLAYTLLEGKIEEFFRRFPNAAGVQVTLSESACNPNECRCQACEHLSSAQRFAKVAEALSRVGKKTGKLVSIRTWGKWETPETLALIPADVICSTKFTLPDFHLVNKPNPIMGHHGDTQEIEFDAFGEYSGWNYFPCYYGDLFAERIRQAADKGVTRMAVRLNLEPRTRYIFDIPYGNIVNVELFRQLGNNPDADPDVQLRKWISRTFPPDAREAAFRLYKKSLEWQRVWLTFKDVNCNDHSRVYKGGVRRIRSQVGWTVPAEFEIAYKELSIRRTNIDRAYLEAVAAVEALGPSVPKRWRDDLKKTARIQQLVAQGNNNCLILYAAHLHREKTGQLPDISGVENDIQSRQDEWKKLDTESFDILFGDAPAEMLKEVKGGA